ncbi:glycogen/starch synthase, ADP-glucose type [Anaeromyxobacter dehalogenans 2CP-1]|uniref:Glycogen synthase n=1 Tax=Anaeromyxobacter dehalogenans (strain ATCC BAA-258 / DSM 21875 / 2CP-1) TaxID=455488 RepID=GLGA_ANAD2|nr:glycogen synthase GlgA [Anaeromyxobacter dehalogenans]B8J8R4.1 RecName: Full=Glycogen synthase; AltName: Full=Starch [bacterial glycogen] synthase [Anaeromyxobacter dehalogenans 2CP-1]ACL63512.1 glycogen/starch synthase, ADP-glucose type [Anaeromyxobacter dehalogenans 2CP-1]
MQILFVASEVGPWSKTGGLGDVAGALPQALAERGNEVAVVTPRHGSIDPHAAGLQPVRTALHVRGEPVALWVKRGPAPVYFVEHPHLFGSRRGLYGEGGRDHGDNAERFAFLTRAALALPAALGLRPRILHLNDWQCGLGPWLLRHEHARDPALAGARTVFTIHNLAYQGLFPKQVLPALGLPWEVFRWEAMEFFDQLSFMKAGLAFADALTTVSPTYAREILTPEGGASLDALLRHRARDLHGILNGIDVHAWDPARDPHLPAHFGAGDLTGKAACKAALQREVGLPVRPEVPVAGLVTRLAEQKGIDLVAAALPALLARDVQVVLLGSGDAAYEQAFARAAREHPDRVAARIGFDEGLAHRIEAGADLFLMPSRFEPCGLNQMYSLRYGTVPVVRAVGGLADTVEDFDGFARGTGFRFSEYTPQALLTATRRALDVFRDRRAWRGLVERGMAEDNSWERSAARYEALYRTLAPGR